MMPSWHSTVQHRYNIHGCYWHRLSPPIEKQWQKQIKQFSRTEGCACICEDISVNDDLPTIEDIQTSRNATTKGRVVSSRKSFVHERIRDNALRNSAYLLSEVIRFFLLPVIPFINSHLKQIPCIRQQ